jgi:hypothetical protein
LRASANNISLVGIEGVTVKAHDLLVEVNQSSEHLWIATVPGGGLRQHLT